MFRGIDHVAVATVEFDETIAAYRRLLGRDYAVRERLESDGIEAAFFDLGTASVEVLGSLNDRSTIARFLEKRGTALHHVAFSVDDAQRTLDELSALGLERIDDCPRKGARARLVAFLHPSAADGVLTELVQQTR